MVHAGQSLLEMYVVSIAVGPSLGRADFVADSVQWSARYRMEMPVGQAGTTNPPVLAIACKTRIHETLVLLRTSAEMAGALFRV